MNVAPGEKPSGAMGESCRNPGRLISRGLSPQSSRGQVLSQGCSWRDTSLLWPARGCSGGTGAVSPPHNAASTRVFFIPVEGAVSADDLCHTPVLSGM